MGCGGSTAVSSALETNDEHNKPNITKNDNTLTITRGSFDKNDIKILLIGAGESGKSTLVKQVKRIYCGGFLTRERESFKDILSTSIISDMQILVDVMINSTYKYSSDIEPAVQAIKSLDPQETIDSTIADILLQVWNDQAMSMVYSESKSLGIAENFEYFMGKIKEIAKSDYVPSDLDILKARIRSIGHSDMKVMINDIKTKIVDIGGQKSERKHWENCFKGLNYIVFVHSLSDFDQVLFEDGETSRTTDSLKIFESLFCHTLLKNLPIFIIFNKTDLFESKLKTSWEAFTKVYEGYEGKKGDIEQCTNHVKKAFEKRIPKDRNGWIDFSFTCAMDDVSVSKSIEALSRHCVDDYKKRE